MALAFTGGSPIVSIGPGLRQDNNPSSFATANTVNVLNEAAIFIGQIETEDGGQHTIDTSGSSALLWNAGTVTFVNAGSTIKVGLADLDTAAGPPGRAVNSGGVITFDVYAALVGGGGGITAAATNTTVPTAGSKTISNGDYIAFAVQMTAQGASDSVIVRAASAAAAHQTSFVTNYTGSAYSLQSTLEPCALIRFSDGKLGWFTGCTFFTTAQTNTFSNATTDREYGQLIQLPFQTKVSGIYTWVDPDGNFDLVLYSDPLGTPVAERTISFSKFQMCSNVSRKAMAKFSSPYILNPNTPIVAACKPTTATTIAMSSRTLVSATHRVQCCFGTSSYGVKRGGSGAFVDYGSSATMFDIGLFLGGFESGVNPSLVLGI